MKWFYRVSLLIYIKFIIPAEESGIPFQIDSIEVKIFKRPNFREISKSADNGVHDKILTQIDKTLKKSYKNNYNSDVIQKKIDSNNFQKNDYFNRTTYRKEISEEDEDLVDNLDLFMTQLDLNKLKNKNKNLLCPPCRCGVKTTKRIVGGKSTASNKFPWIALLAYKRKYYCGGSLINDRFVITAGHCTNGINTKNIHVYLSEFKRSFGNISETIIREVKNVYRPIGYNDTTFNNDISLLKLNRPVDINSGLIRPICLPHDKSSFVGKNAIVTGWGVKYKQRIPITNLLRIQSIRILSNHQCRQTVLGELITSNMICGGYHGAIQTNGTGICGGDTGGPLMILQNQRQRLAGIVSWGLGCSIPITAGIFTRITKFNGWLRKLSEGACWCD